jgi:cathepsin L
LFDSPQTEAAFEFGKFVEKFNKEYASETETMYRLSVFAQNLQVIKEHNAKGETYTLGVTKFADLTPEEFKAMFHGFRRSDRVRDDTAFRKMRSMVEQDVPASVDWRTKNAVTPVKNQAQCGSCWSFSATGSIEGAWAIAKGQLVSLSEQQLMDCSGSFGNFGCNGGLMDNAFKYVEKNGLCSEDSYPYQAQDGTCHSSNCTKVATISSYHDITANDNAGLKVAVAQQPVSVAVEADQSSWQLYTGGVISKNCGTSLDHGVLAVGYGTDSSTGQEYWIVKNSWGADWGEQGYIRILRTDAQGPGLCGIATDASYPVV